MSTTTATTTTTADLPPQRMLERLQSAEEAATVLADENAFYRKSLVQLKYELQMVRNQYTRLEQTMESRDEQVDSLQEQCQQLTRSKRQVEKTLATEMFEHEKEQALWQEREFQYQEQFKAMKAQLLRQQDQAVREVQNTPTTADDALVYLSEAREAQRELKEQEKTLMAVQAELERTQLEFRAAVEQANAQQLRVAYLESEVAEKTRQHQEMTEEVEAYQRLIKEMTESGDVRLDKWVKKRMTSDLARELHLAYGFTLPTAQASHARHRSMASQDSVMSREHHLEQDVNLLTEQVHELRSENVSLKLFVNKVLTQILGVDQLAELGQGLINASGQFVAGHRKTSSLAVQSTVNKSDKANKRAQSMIVQTSEREATQQAIQQAGEESVGLWKKALKRMSVATWRANAATTAAVAEVSIEEEEETTVAEEEEEEEEEERPADVAEVPVAEAEEPEDQGFVDDIDVMDTHTIKSATNDDIDDDDDQPLRTQPMTA